MRAIHFPSKTHEVHTPWPQILNMVDVKMLDWKMTSFTDLSHFFSLKFIMMTGFWMVERSNNQPKKLQPIWFRESEKNRLTIVTVFQPIVFHHTYSMIRGGQGREWGEKMPLFLEHSLFSVTIQKELVIKC